MFTCCVGCFALCETGCAEILFCYQELHWWLLVPTSIPVLFYSCPASDLAVAIFKSVVCDVDCLFR